MVKRKRRSITKSNSKTKVATFSYRSGLSPYAFGHSLGIVGIILVLIYAVLVWFANFSELLFIRLFPLEFSFHNWTLIIGLIEIYVFGYIFGWIFSKVYNRSLMNV